MKYFSQGGQDRWVVEELYKNKRNGFFIEMGAADGKMSSNTLCLERELGWSGLCIEPNPDFIPALKRNRGCKIEQELVFSKSGQTVNFSKRADLSGIEGHINSRSHGLAVKFNKIKDTIQLTTVTLEELLDKNKVPRFIEVFSLDTEGSEYEIMKDFPFGKYDFGVIFVEVSQDTINDIRQLFTSKGYKELMPFKNDLTFVHPSVLHQYMRSDPVIYYGRKQQDEWVLQTLDYKQDGYFLDIGCGDGVKLSNTYVLEKYYGWDGLCIDGDERAYKKAKIARNVPVINAVLDRKKRIVDFVYGNRGSSRIQEYGSVPGTNVEKIRTKLIKNILTNACDHTMIDFMSMNISGAEIPVLQSFPFDKFTMRCSVINHSRNKDKIEQINSIMNKHGYKLEKKGKFDLYYVC